MRLNKPIHIITLTEYFSFITLRRACHSTNWSYPIESMLISSIAGNKNTVNLATDEDYYYQDNNENLDSIKYILRKWEIMLISQLNTSYFKLDSSQYQELISQ